MRTVAAFRFLLIGSAALVLVAVGLRATRAGVPTELVRYMRDTAPLFSDWHGIANYVLGLMALLLFARAIIALFLFRSLAKEAGITAILVFGLYSIIRGPNVESGWTTALEYWGIALLGASLGLAFVAPIKELFPHD